MKTTRILILKTSKRLRQRKNKYLSYLRPFRSTVSLPVGVDGTSVPEVNVNPPVIFFTCRQRESIANAAKEHAPKNCRTTVEYADRLCAGEIDIFGCQLDITNGINWHLDHHTGRTWPKTPAARIGVMYPHDKSDIKHPWEIARFQFLGTLGRAWAYTGDNKYPRQAREIIQSFIADNPPEIGIHWANPMEAAIRSANWIVADSYFAGAPGWDSEFRGRLRCSLFQHGRFIRRHLERDGRGINNNHYTADLAGLFILGLYLRDINQCREWFDFALSELNREIDDQIASDGMHYENSLGYHRLTFEMLFYTQRLGLLNGIDDLHRWSPILQKMARFTQAATMPNGRVPNFGDNDDGVWLSGSTRRPDDHRYVPLLAAAAYDRPARRIIHPALEEVPEDIFWFVGAEAAQAVATDKSRHETDSEITHSAQSQVFAKSGIVVMRSPDTYVLVSANPVGTGGIGGHKHNDLLSFIFAVGNQEIVIDPGTYAYTAEPALRNALRSTRAHNTVMIDSAEQNRFYRRQLFWVRDDARPVICSWRSDGKLDRLTVRHDGYRRLPGRLIHTRHFVFDKENKFLAIRDEITGSGEHDLSSALNFGEGMLTPVDEGRISLRFDGGNSEAGFITDTHLPWRRTIEPAWRSERYRQKRPSYRLVQHCRVELPASWTTVIGVSPNQPVDWTMLVEFANTHFPEDNRTGRDVEPAESILAEPIAVS